MRNVRFSAFVTATAVAVGAWTGTAAALVEPEATSATTQESVATDYELAIDVRVADYIARELKSVPAISVTVSPGGDVSAPSVGGGIIGPPPPPPIVREALYRVARTVGLDGVVEITISRHGGDVSAPSVGGGIIGPPPPPPIVRYLLDEIDRRLSIERSGSFAVIELANAAGERVVYRAPSL